MSFVLYLEFIMKYGNKTNGIGFDGNQVDMKKCNKHRSFNGKRFVNVSAVFYFITALLTSFTFTGSTNAQYLVQPGKIEMNVS
jgi:hypothetical protein